jgi:hypothetical protein
MTRYQKEVSPRYAGTIVWTPELAKREARFEDAELPPEEVDAREWSFDPAFPMASIGSNVGTKPWLREKAIEWLNNEIRYRQEDYGDDYYNKMDNW